MRILVTMILCWQNSQSCIDSAKHTSDPRGYKHYANTAKACQIWVCALENLVSSELPDNLQVQKQKNWDLLMKLISLNSLIICSQSLNPTQTEDSFIRKKNGGRNKKCREPNKGKVGEPELSRTISDYKVIQGLESHQFRKIRRMKGRKSRFSSFIT